MGSISMKKSESSRTNTTTPRMFSFAIIHPPDSFHIHDEDISKILDHISSDISIPQEGTIHIAFLPDSEIQLLNRDHRWIDATTDVLSFHYYEDFSRLKKADIAGEILFSESKILTQSKEYWHSPREEFSILLVHSVLHLLWFDHEQDEDFEIMWKHETTLRKKMNLNSKR